MKRIIFIISLFLCLPLAAQQTYSARVVDTETGEALPYVYVYITKEQQHVNTCGTVTDAQGCFECSATPNSTLLFSCVGYEKLTLKASDLKKTVRLTPLVTLMNELTVSPISAQKILEKAASELNKDYEKHKREMSYYSIDATLIGKDSTTLEHRRGYFESDCNLRFFQFNCTANDSTYGVADVPGDIDVIFNYQTHLCKFLSIGPLIKESKFWRSAITPLGNPELYASSYVTQIGTDGQRVLKINVAHLKENSKRKVQKRTALLGTLYLDAETYLPLRYDGSVKNLKFKNLPTELDFHIIYHYKYGFAEVTQLYLSGHNKKYRFRFGLRYRETLDKNVQYVYRTSYYAGIATPTPKEEIKRYKDYQKSIKKSIARKYRKKQKTFTKKYNELFKNCKRVYIDR